jgi:protein TonB
MPAAVAPAAPTAVPIDPKAVEAEVQRQLAARRKELEKAAAAARKQEAPASGTAPAQQAAPPIPSPAPAVLEPTEIPPTAAPPTAVPTPRPQPTAVPQLSEPEKEPEVKRGDLVGPGAGVVEPQLIAPPRVVYPALARQQRVEGKVVVLVLVDEQGHVAESRLQQGLANQPAVNEAVLQGVRSAKFRGATKNGIPVKMWRPVIVDVKP